MLLISLVFVSIIVSPLQVSIEEAVRENHQLAVQEIATTINLAEISQGITTYNIYFPGKGNEICQIELRGGTIKAVFADSQKQETVFAHYLTITRISVSIPNGNIINCKEHDTITVKKTQDGVLVS